MTCPLCGGQLDEDALDRTLTCAECAHSFTSVVGDHEYHQVMGHTLRQSIVRYDTNHCTRCGTQLTWVKHEKLGYRPEYTQICLECRGTYPEEAA